MKIFPIHLAPEEIEDQPTNLIPNYLGLQSQGLILLYQKGKFLRKKKLSVNAIAILLEVAYNTITL